MCLCQSKPAWLKPFALSLIYSYVLLVYRNTLFDFLTLFLYVLGKNVLVFG
ncbi:hypothetical protein BDU57DRAFT_543590 [Ampelomyces quisqualis]|uniref:Uncharacterized protein n=1 Tax=Ampelomyces quisqualis TaxID=50730 RepID=A0A6A5Q5X8_AMPQU|nr:hypothetical protein BDU57DRAFT_543590 [Ampelomyces quisqualis]